MKKNCHKSIDINKIASQTQVPAHQEGGKEHITIV